MPERDASPASTAPSGGLGTAAARAVLAREARTELAALGARGQRLQLVDREPWRLGNLPAGRAREASVLMLFGPRDGARAAAPVAETDVLILVRAATLRQHAGQPAFPGGRVDPEDRAAQDPAVEAALREAMEETGVDRAGIDVLGRLASVPLPVSGHVVTPVLGWWREPSPVQVVDDAESSLVVRVPVRDLLDPSHRHLATVTRGPATHHTPAFTVPVGAESVTIWGFTGILLDRLLHRLGWELPWGATRRIPAPR
ncbi:CoA pyrophosphatase [Rothia kristinae]|uniref:NUDIX hydrolase n=1 Tax=Rothia kristinae TaxID=37923 RepID=UPI001CD4670B|nr:CoA pyrophosphatase [Rothia kristinae]MCA1170733.1 CoA pyrophosphatase [Rothia kristinae]